MKKLLVRFLRDENGEDLIEYGLLAAFVAALGIAVLITNPDLKTALIGAFGKAKDALNQATQLQ